MRSIKEKLITVPVAKETHHRIHSLAKNRGIPVRVLMRKGIELLIQEIEKGEIIVSSNVERADHEPA